MPIIELENVTYTYPKETEPALYNVNLEIEKGEFIVLTGPTGCGKSTLCRCFNGLIPHFSKGKLKGIVKICGLNTKEHSVHELAQHVGMVFQNPENQLVSMNVEREIAFGPENLGLPREEISERIGEALQKVGIYHLKDKAPYELSGGQQQRVAIASILAMSPDVIVLDEPTSELDIKCAEEVLATVKHLNEKHQITVFLVEHRLEKVVSFADRLLVMEEGGLILDGEPRKVLEEYGVLAEIGIGVPKVVQLIHLLREDGWGIEKLPLTPEETKTFLGELGAWSSR